MAEYDDVRSLVFFLVLFMPTTYEEEIYVSNLNPRCMRCLCAASSGCPDEPLGCIGGHCGPFQISKNYWLDAVEGTPLESKEDAVYQGCANSYACASQMVTYYFVKFGRDCNDDGVTTCEDFLMINYNGGYGCRKSLYRNPSSKMYLRRYTNCTEGFIL